MEGKKGTMKRKNDLMEGRKEKGHTAQCLAFNKRLVITEEEEEKGGGEREIVEQEERKRQKGSEIYAFEGGESGHHQ